MTIIGVWDVWDFLVLGFGIKNSLDGVSDLQYSKYTKFSATIIYNPMALDKDLDKFNEEIKSNQDIKESFDIATTSSKYKKAEKKFLTKKITVFTTDTIKRIFKIFWTL